MKITFKTTLVSLLFLAGCANPPSAPSSSGVVVGQGGTSIAGNSDVSTGDALSISFEVPVTTGDLNDENIILSFGDSGESFSSTFKSIFAATAEVTCDPDNRVPDTSVEINSDRKATIVTSGTGQLPCGRVINMCISGIRDANGTVLPPYSTTFRTAACEIPTNAGAFPSVNEYAPLQNSSGVDTGRYAAVSNSTIVARLKVRDSKARTLVYDLLDDAGGRFELVSPNIIRVKDATLLNYESATTHTIRLKSTNPPGTETRVENLTIDVINVNERPSSLALSSQIIGETAAEAAVVGTFSITDVDEDDTHDYEFTSGGNPGSYFEIVGNQLRRSSTPNIGTSDITLVVKAIDAEGLESATASFLIDVKPAPAVTSVNSSYSNGRAPLGATIPVTVNFNNAVTVTGSPQILLETGSTDRYATYVSGSGTTALVFNYVVSAGDATSDLDYVSTSSLGLNGGTIRDADGTDSYLTLASPGAANSLGNNKAIEIDTVIPTVSSVTSSTSNGYVKLGDVVPVQVVFSEAVTVTGTPQLTLSINDAARTVNYASGSGGTTLVFNYTVQAGDLSSDLDYFSSTALALNGGTIADLAGNNAILTLADPGNSNSLGDNKAIQVDGVVPTVSSVTSALTNGTYKIGDTVHVDVTFSSAVVVTGTPVLTLETGSTDATANYLSGSGTDTLRFQFTVSSPHASSDLEVQSSSALTVSSASIKDAAGNDATRTLPTSGGTSLSGSKAIVIDGVRPTVSAVTSTSTDGTYVGAQTVLITVTFNDSVTVTGSPRLTLETGSTDTDAVYTSGSGSSTLVFTYTVATGDVTSDLEYASTSALGLNSGTIKDANGNDATLTLPTLATSNSIGGSKAIVVDAVVPTVSSISSTTSNGSYKQGDTVNVRVIFSEAVTITGTPAIALDSGGSATYTSGSGSTTIDFTYTVGASQTSSDLNASTTSALTISSATIKDAAGNDASLTLTTSGGTSLAGSKAIVIDTTVPTVSNVTSAFTNGYAKAGDTVSVQVVFSEAVNVTGTPQLTLQISGSGRAVNYASGSGTTTLVFSYVVQSGDASSDLDYSATGSLALNGGTIRDAALNDATLTLATPGAANSLGNNKAIVVDGTAPTITSVDAAGGMNTTHNIGDVITVRVNFSKAVTISGSAPTLDLAMIGGNVSATCSTISAATLTDCTYTVVEGDEASDLNYAATNSFVHSSGSIVDAAGNSASLTLPGTGGAGSLATNNSIVVDGVSPTVSLVTSSTNNGTYAETEVISIQVQFSEIVNVTVGTPRLTLETGSSDAVVNYVSGTGTNTLTFTYTVGATDQSSDLNYASTSALALNGAVIRDANGNDAVLTLPDLNSGTSLAGGKALVVRGAPIVVSSVTSDKTNGTYGSGEEIVVLVNFTGPVFVTGTPTLTLETGSTDAVANYDSGSGTDQLSFKFTTSNGHTSADLDYVATTSLALNGGTINDATTTAVTRTLASPGAANSLGANKAIVIDAVKPTVTSVTSSSTNGKFVIGDTINVTVNFSETVNVDGGSPRILLETGDTDQYATYSSGSGSSALSFTYTVQEGDVSADLDYVTTTSLELDGSTINDARDNTATLTLASPGAANSIGNAKALVVDGVRPEVTSVTSADADATYKSGDALSFTVTFSEAVWVTGTPTLLLETGATDRTASYASGSGTTELVFNYTIQSSDNSADLNYESTEALSLAGGTIRDANSAPRNDANLTLPATSSGSSLGGSKALVIDGVIPTVTGVTSTASNGTVLYGESITIQVNFSENVTVTGTPQLTLSISPSNQVLNYVGGSGTSTLTFDYTVPLDDKSSADVNNLADLDYVGTTSLALNGGTIKDASGNNATLTLATPGAAGSLAANKDIKIDGVAPTIVNVTSSSSNASYMQGTEINVKIQFSEAITVSGANPVLTLETGATDGTGAYVGVVQTAFGVNDTLSFTYTVGSGENSSDLDLNSTPLSNLTSIKAVRITGGRQNPIVISSMPAAAAAGSLSANKAIVVDTTAPVVSSVSSTTDNANDQFIGDTIAIQVNFNEPVTVTGTPFLTLTTGASGNRAIYASGSGTSTLTFNHVVVPGSSSADLDYASTTALSLDGGDNPDAVITDIAGNNGTLTLATPGAAGSLAANEALVVDGIRPIITSFSQVSSAGRYGIDLQPQFIVNFNTAVWVTGTPGILMTPNRYATYVSGSGTSALTFGYTVVVNDNDTLNVRDPWEYGQTLLQGTIKDRSGGIGNSWNARTHPSYSGTATYNTIEDITIGNNVPQTLNARGLIVDGYAPYPTHSENPFSPLSGSLPDLSRTYSFYASEDILSGSVSATDFSWYSTCDLAAGAPSVTDNRIDIAFTESTPCTEDDVLFITLYYGGVTDLAQNTMGDGYYTAIYRLDTTAPTATVFSPATSTITSPDPMPTTVDVTLAADIDSTSVTTADFGISDTCDGTVSISSVVMRSNVARVTLAYVDACTNGQTVTLTHTRTGTDDLAGNAGTGSANAVYTYDDGLAVNGASEDENNSIAAAQPQSNSGGIAAASASKDPVALSSFSKSARTFAKTSPPSEPGVIFEFRSPKAKEWRSSGIVPTDAAIQIRAEEGYSRSQMLEWELGLNLACLSKSEKDAQPKALKVKTQLLDSPLRVAIDLAMALPSNSACELKAGNKNEIAYSFNTAVENDFDGDAIADKIVLIPAKDSNNFLVVSDQKILGVWDQAEGYRDLRFAGDWQGLGTSGVLASWWEEDKGCFFGYFQYQNADDINFTRSEALWKIERSESLENCKTDQFDMAAFEKNYSQFAPLQK